MGRISTILFASVFVLFLTVVCSQDVEEPLEGEMDEEPQNPSAAEQYLGFITSGGKNMMDQMDEEDDGSYGPTVPPDGEDEDYTAETLNILLKYYRDEFEDLSIDKKKSKLMEDIKKMDLNEDGYITKPELVSWLIAEAEKGSHLEAKGLGGIKSFDTNKDEKLSWEEVLEDLKKLGSMSNPTFVKGLKMEKIRFDHADKDKDGFLSDTEYPFYATPEYFSSMNNYTVMSYLSDYDTDDDWKVSKEEYLKGFDKTDEEGIKIEEEKFTKMDKNNDGFLTADEVSDVALDFTLTKFVDKHADMLFVNVDTDKDGKLSSVEIITNYPLFTKGTLDNKTASAEEFTHDEL